MPSDFTVGTATAPAGSIARGALQIFSSARGGEEGVPVVIANGRADGPVLAIICGIHGDEYDGRVAVAEVLRKIDLDQMHGTLVFLPVVSPSAHDAASRLSAIDSVNMNAAFPGNASGTSTRRIASTLFTELTTWATHVVDLHSGGHMYDIHPYIMCHVEGPAGPAAEQMATHYGPGAILRSDKTSSWVGGMLYSELTRAGIPAILTEAGGEARLREDAIEHQRAAISNLMAWLEMTPNVVPVEPAMTWTQLPENEPAYVAADTSGLLRQTVRVGDVVSPGDVVGQVLDIYGDVVESVTTDRPGIILDLRTLPLVRDGDPIALVASVFDRA